MKQFWLQVIVLIAVSLVGIFFYSSYSNLQTFSVPSLNYLFNTNPADLTKTNPSQNATQKISIADKASLNVEIADTPEKRSLGLGGRDFLATDSGMLFLFDTSTKHQFWMKGMKIPLDFIWIKGDVIVDLLPKIPPPAPGTPD